MDKKEFLEYVGKNLDAFSTRLSDSKNPNEILVFEGVMVGAYPATLEATFSGFKLSRLVITFDASNPELVPTFERVVDLLSKSFGKPKASPVGAPEWREWTARSAAKSSSLKLPRLFTVLAASRNGTIVVDYIDKGPAPMDEESDGLKEAL